MPRLNITRQKIGIIRERNGQPNSIPSIIQKKRKTSNVRAKFIRDETFFEKRNRYLGRFIFEKMSAFPRSALIAPFVESVKKEKTIFPQNI